MPDMRWISGGAVLAAIALTMVGTPAAQARTSGPPAVVTGQAASPPAHQAADAVPRLSTPTNATVLSSVSCRDPSFCMAAGVAGFFRQHPVTEIWNGTSWRGLATPAPVHAFNLFGVSCASRMSCMAIGGANMAHPFALSWNGRRWHILAAPSAQSVLSGISCPAQASCMAVGHTGPLVNQSSSALAEMWNGHFWRALAMPAVPGSLSAKLSSVSCTGIGSCVAVGSYVSSAPGNLQLTLAEAWDGTSWRLLTTPAAGSAGSSLLSAVSCASASSCMAVGIDNIVQGSSSDALTERWDGHSWLVIAAAIPAQTEFSSLAGVWCSSAARCMAVGTSVAAVGDEQVLTEQWSGSSWQLLPAPSPYNDLNDLVAVSCPSANNCTAVGGGDLFGITAADSLAEHWDGLHWLVHRTGQFDDLLGVSCPSATRCMAVGAYISKSDNGLTLAQSWNGRAWRQRGTPTPTAFDQLSDVSCAGRSFCMAVGGGSQGFAQRWNGKRWQSVPIPTNSQLTSVSCASATRCLAIGSDTALAWNGVGWRLVPPANVSGSVDFGLSDVSCPRANLCVAVGSYDRDVHGPSLLLAERWNGRSWKLLLTSFSNVNGELTAVDCAGPATCMAVGSYFTTAQHELSERWNGRTWQMGSPPGLPGFGPGLVDVSCPGAALCVAVGHYSLQFASPIIALTERWNGRVWQRIKPARPGDALDSVSCAGTSRCIAVGNAGNLTRAEQWNGSVWQLLKSGNP